jgi:methionyl-tRNA formyltransferase
MAGAPLRLLFFGTPEFAVPSLRALAHSRHSVVGVVSQPDRPRGRGRKLEPTPVSAAAQELGVPVLQVDKVGDPDALAWMRELAPDLGIVVAFGQFIPKPVRELPPHGLINAHGSLLPRHRGAAPIQYTILAGDAQAGVTIIRIVKEMDAGDWCLESAVDVGPEETAGELAERLAALAGPALLESADQIAAGTAVFRAQDHAHATLAPKLTRDFAVLNWEQPRGAILRRIRAATPWPGCDVALRRSAIQCRLLGVRDGGPFEQPQMPGSVTAAAGRLRIAALDGWVEVSKLRVPGKREMAAGEFLRGARIPEDEEVGTS